MSWSVSVPQTPAEEFLDAVESATLTDTSNPPALVAQWEAQLDAAKTAVHAVFSHTGIFGDLGTYSATMSGHANHTELDEPTLYTTSEFISVTVNRQPPTEVKPS